METGTIEITAGYPALAFFYGLFQPNYEIDGKLEKRPWGTHSFAVPPGRHLVEVSYPWLFISRAGKNSMQIDVAPGQIVRVRYRASMIRYVPGTMTVEGQLPQARVIE